MGNEQNKVSSWWSTQKVTDSHPSSSRCRPECVSGPGSHNRAPAHTADSSSRALISLIRELFLSLLDEPKALSSRSCFFLWISTILSSTESFTINCGTGNEDRMQTLESDAQTKRSDASNVIFELTFVTTTFLVCPSRWQRSMHCSSEAGFQAWNTYGTVSQFLGFVNLSHFPVSVATKACGFSSWLFEKHHIVSVHFTCLVKYYRLLQRSSVSFRKCNAPERNRVFQNLLNASRKFIYGAVEANFSRLSSLSPGSPRFLSAWMTAGEFNYGLLS